MSKPDNEGKYTCEKCGATFALERHKQIHEHSKREEEGEKELQQGTHKPTVKPDLSGNPPGEGPAIMQYMIGSNFGRIVGRVSEHDVYMRRLQQGSADS